MARRPDVESIPADLDRFLATFFARGGWRSEIKYDPSDDRLYLEVRLESRRLSADDRFLSLVEYFARAQDAVLRQRAGLPLQCRHLYWSLRADARPFRLRPGSATARLWPRALFL